MTTATTAVTQQRFQLAYGDCDAVGISYFAINYPWMERTYSVWLHSFGLDSHTLLDTVGVYTVGLKSECQYITSCEVFDELTCTVVLDHLGTTSYALGFDFERGDELVAHGKITFAVRGADGKKAQIPERLLAALRTLEPPRTTEQ
ncbi:MULTISPECIES: acyl-CoA thioesterase [unclassified Rhodococcus (in: high G+C Gram-positive bacteria)]|uniref:acyl-CoA thioesterase n=1 Tax=unclassified Rhodococcus (in: high G+C Gram-positive bacteria) TaxID=192944 RepID=UPI00092608BB|nr:hotdog domain-containing protein [Rhodococcus sp. M8]OLL19488.1 thioesterase [Rhodococcus sp. M8]QPG43321.1 acyl-CoA thioesterase [Rhodococcus sp. M8]